MSTSPENGRQENSVSETVYENLNSKNSIEDCNLTCLNASLDGQCDKLRSSDSRESTVVVLTTQNDCQDEAVSNDTKVNGSDEKIGNDLQLHTDKVEALGYSVSVHKEEIPLRINLNSDEICTLTKDELTECWLQQNKYISYIVAKIENNSNEEIKVFEANEEKYKLQLAELQKKEQYHAMRLTAKEHELQDLVIQMDELKACMGSSSLKYCMLDPATYLLFERMKRDLDSTKCKMEETQNELAAWKFTPDSNTGKQLMAKCRLLIKENEELGKIISSGRLSKLEGDLALQRNFGDEFKKSQSEVDEFLQEMDEDTEGMQGTILLLQSELRLAREDIIILTGQMAATPGLNGSSIMKETAEEIVTYPNGAHSEEEKDSSIAPVEVLFGDMESESVTVGCKRTRSAIEDELDGSEMCVPYKRERTKSPELVENGL